MDFWKLFSRVQFNPLVKDLKFKPALVGGFFLPNIYRLLLIFNHTTIAGFRVGTDSAERVHLYVAIILRVLLIFRFIF